MWPAQWDIWLSCQNVCQRSERKGFSNYLIQHRVDSTWVFVLLKLHYIVISWDMPLFKVWGEDKLNKKFVVSENFAELVSKGIKAILFIFVYFMSAWRDRMLHATSDLAD